MRFPRSCKIKNYELAKNKDVLKIKDKFSSAKINSISNAFCNIKSEPKEPYVKNERIETSSKNLKSDLLVYRRKYQESLDSLKTSNANNKSPKETNSISFISNSLHQNNDHQIASLPLHEFDALMKFDGLNATQQVNLINK